MYFRVIDGSIKKGDKICFMANGKVIKTPTCLGLKGFVVVVVER